MKLLIHFIWIPKFIHVSEQFISFKRMGTLIHMELQDFRLFSIFGFAITRLLDLVPGPWSLAWGLDKFETWKATLLPSTNIFRLTFWIIQYVFDRHWKQHHRMKFGENGKSNYRVLIRHYFAEKTITQKEDKLTYSTGRVYYYFTWYQFFDWISLELQRHGSHVLVDS